LGERASETALAAVRSELGTDQPVLTQLWQVTKDLAKGDLGTSLIESRPVTEIISSRLGLTLRLAGLALALATVSGITIGLLAGMSTSRVVGVVTRGTILTSLAVPTFALGLILLLVVGVQLKWAPAGGWSGELGGLRYLWLPAIALSIHLATMIARSTSRAAQSVRESQYYEAAVSRGLSRQRLVLRHVLPNSLLPVIVIVGVNAAYLVSGTVTIEAVFGLPGLGSRLADAARTRDFPVVQGIAVASAVLVVIVNWITDLAVTVLDPRVRHAG
jgi:peptide/nickel transport system permease protein